MCEMPPPPPAAAFMMTTFMNLSDDDTKCQAQQPAQLTVMLSVQ